MTGPPPAFTCPRCGAESWNRYDGEQGYCSRCHWWTGDALLGQIDPPPVVSPVRDTPPVSSTTTEEQHDG